MPTGGHSWVFKRIYFATNFYCLFAALCLFKIIFLNTINDCFCPCENHYFKGTFCGTL